jgi:hypothetical protein
VELKQAAVRRLVTRRHNPAQWDTGSGPRMRCHRMVPGRHSDLEKYLYMAESDSWMVAELPQAETGRLPVNALPLSCRFALAAMRSPFGPMRLPPGHPHPPHPPPQTRQLPIDTTSQTPPSTLSASSPSPPFPNILSRSPAPTPCLPHPPRHTT